MSLLSAFQVSKVMDHLKAEGVRHAYIPVALWSECLCGALDHLHGPTITKDCLDQPPPQAPQ